MVEVIILVIAGSIIGAIGHLVIAAVKKGSDHPILGKNLEDLFRRKK